MTKNRRKKQIISRLFLAAALLSAAGFFFIRFIPTRAVMSLSTYFGITRDYEVGTVIDFLKTEHPGRVIEDRIYLDYDCVNLHINPSVYHDSDAGLLIATMPDEMLTLDLSGGKTPGGEAGILDGTLYVSLDFLSEVTDIQVRVYEDPKRIFIETPGKTTCACVSRKAPVRVGAGIRSKVLEVCDEGTEVRVSEDESVSPKWVRAVTADGIAGFMERRFLSDFQEKDPAYDGGDPGKQYVRHFLDDKVNLAFHQTDNQESNALVEGKLEHAEGINVIAPTWFYLDSMSGDIRDVSSVSYVEKMHQRGLEVWPVLNDFDGSTASVEETAQFVSSFESRMKAVGAVAEALDRCGADGLVLDFELVREAGSLPYLEFIRELGVEVRKRGLRYSICNTVPGFSSYLNRAEQARVADYVIVMCYDEHAAGASKAGSVASLPFVRKGISDTLLEVPAEQLIAAGPFYTRLWTTEEGERPKSQAFGMKGAAEKLAEHGMTAEWDEKTGQNYAEIKEGNALLQIWLEDADSIAAKAEVMRDSGCAGYAWWKLGFETDDIWGVLKQYL